MFLQIWVANTPPTFSSLPQNLSEVQLIYPLGSRFRQNTPFLEVRTEQPASPCTEPLRRSPVSKTPVGQPVLFYRSSTENEVRLKWKPKHQISATVAYKHKLVKIPNPKLIYIQFIYVRVFKRPARCHNLTEIFLIKIFILPAQFPTISWLTPTRARPPYLWIICYFVPSLFLSPSIGLSTHLKPRWGWRLCSLGRGSARPGNWKKI